MFPAIAIMAATIGLVAIVYMIWDTVGDVQAPREKNTMIAACAVTVAVGVWQAAAHLFAASGGAH